MKRPEPRNEPPRLRRVRIPDTVVPLPPSAVQDPRDEEEQQRTSRGDTPQEPVR